MVYNIGMVVGYNHRKGKEMNITIYQPVNPTFRVDENKNDYTLTDYKNIYEGKFLNTETDAEGVLEEIFMAFQGNKPATYKGHSLSVGDIVKLENDYYICGNVGWKKIQVNFKDIEDSIKADLTKLLYKSDEPLEVILDDYQSEAILDADNHNNLYLGWEAYLEDDGSLKVSVWEW